MKKIFLIMAAVAAMFAANAQSSTDRAYISVRGGASGLVHPSCNGYENFGHTLEGQASLQFGYWITPQVAFGIEGTAGFENGSKLGLFQGKNWVNHVDVLALAKFNLNNVFRGYRGYADKVEFVPTVGIGWTHGWTYLGHSNDIVTKYAIDVNYNVSEKVQLNFSPFLAYNLTGAYQGVNNPRFDSRNAWWGLEVGVTYKFGNGFKPYVEYPQAEIDALNAQINELRARKPETKVVEKEVEKIVEKQVDKLVYADIVIPFRNNSSKLGDYEKAILRTIPKNLKVQVVGSATKPGNIDRNKELSEQRAKVVADYLKSVGVNDVTTKAVGTELNERVAVVKIQVD